MGLPFQLTIQAPRGLSFWQVGERMGVERRMDPGLVRSPAANGRGRPSS